MSPRLLLLCATIFTCLVMLVCIAGQRRELAALRSELQPPPTPDEKVGDSLAAAAETEGQSGSTPAPGPVTSVSSELLRLRSQVTQLMDRKRELTGARGENEQLRAQLAARGTNAPAGQPFPPGYIRKSEAQWAGASTPENTIQSFLWAVRNHDLTNVLQLMTPEAGLKLMQRAGNAPEKFLEDFEGLPAMRVFNLQALPDGSIQAEAETPPGLEVTKIHFEIHFRMIEGQWKLDFP
jgi:hypothetical protein